MTLSHGPIIRIEVRRSHGPFPQRTVVTYYEDGCAHIKSDHHYVSPAPPKEPSAAA